MKSPAYGLHVLILTFLLISCLQAEILNVPDDHETIQAAIDAAEDGDTVLVDPGEYVENIDFNGKNITVASLYLIDPNDDYINSTIIDGDENGSVVTFENEETEDAVLTGFTIQNGAARNGGGICCLESSPTISYCVIMDNFAQSYGGGIYFRQVDMIIECCYIINNHSPINSGYGGFYSLCSDITFDHCIISDNGVGENTNTFVIHASNNTFINCTFSNNSSNNDVFIRINSESVVSFENSIIWLNSAGCISLTDDCVITFSYTNFEGGQENISSNGGEVNWGEGNIDDDPLFSDPDNGDYHLTENSPCIDAGDPDSPEDPDETRADMGAYYFDQRRDDEIEWTEHVIDGDFDGAYDVDVADIDGDGDIDVVGVAEDDNTVAWWENDGNEEFQRHVIDNNFTRGRVVLTVDFDGDGDIDVIAGAATRGGQVKWYENNNGDFEGHVIDDEIYVNALFAEDIDSDGDIDLLGSWEQPRVVVETLFWWENDGEQNFEVHYERAPSRIQDVVVLDIDDDGDIDILACTESRDESVIWWENDGSQDFSEESMHIICEDISNSSTLFPVDFDDDNDIDIILGTDQSQVYWLENNGNENFEYHLIMDDLEGVTSVYVVDLDFDEDLDVLISKYGEEGNYITWMENLGNDEFSENVIDEDFNGCWSLKAVDLDQDGDFDCVGSSRFEDSITWWENNLNPPIPDIAVEPDALDFGEVNVDEISEQTFTITNNGEADLIISEISTEGDYFAVEFEDEFLLETDQEVEITVTFSPEEEGEFAGVITIISNDPDAREVEVTLAGIGRRDDEIEWTEHVIDGDFDGAYDVYAADIDGDGDMDIIGVAFDGGYSAFWENNGNEEFERVVIDVHFNYGVVVKAVDLNSDGNIDVIAGTDGQGRLVKWYEYIEGNFWGHVLESGIPNGVHSLYPQDIDSDGDIDILAGRFNNENALMWWENDGEQNMERYWDIDGCQRIQDVAALDLNEDGEIDFLACRDLSDEAVIWLENNGNEEFNQNCRHAIFSGVEGCRTIFPVDFDGDEDIDIVLGSDTEGLIFWLENDGDEDFEYHLIAEGCEGVTTVYMVDFDLDDDLDVLVSLCEGDDNIIWLENHGDNEFSRYLVSDGFGTPLSVIADDVDGDGDFDIVGASYDDDEITWWENNIIEIPHPDIAVEPMELDFGEVNVNESEELSLTIINNGDENLTVEGFSVEGEYFEINNENGFMLRPNQRSTRTVTFSPEEAGEFAGIVTITSNDPQSREVEVALAGIAVHANIFTAHQIHRNSAGARAIAAVEMNNDGNIDIVACEMEDLYWYENNGEQEFEEHHIAQNSDDIHYPRKVVVIDFDGDDDLDIFLTNYTGNSIYWYENSGDNEFEEHVVDDDFRAPRGLNATDFDNDGDVDVIAGGVAGDGLAWWENDGDQNLEKHVIGGDEENSCYSIYTVDYDEDGDMDVIAGDFNGQIIFWENDGDQEFDRHIIEQSQHPGSVYTIDLDNDADLDVLTASYSINLIFWLENEGNGDYSNHVINNHISRCYSVSAADFDLDGDTDILAAGDDETCWWENDGEMGLTEHAVPDNLANAMSVVPIDLDKDGDFDILGGALNAATTWWENNLNPPIPDIAVEPDALDFGEVNVDEISEQTFSISNNGEADLIVSEISIEDDYFSVEFEEEIVLEPDEEVEITVAFAPEETGEYAGLITIFS
ncbi:FG-GAP-like repeat-containing protein, partial [bacterium]|nr:FG-GAP-like repeat-containing protein [bacterium]